MRYAANWGIGLLASVPVLCAMPATAKIIDQSEIGFTVAHTANVAATPEEVWTMLRMPQKWWSKEHSWSGNADNFWLDAQAGGCFCEKLPGDGDTFGSAQHARIIFAKPGEMMRLSGALGPLQGEALTGTLTILIKQTPTGSMIRFDYVVGGYMRFKVAEIAPVVDDVINQQLVGLAKALGGTLPAEGAEKAKPQSDLGSAVADLTPETESAPETASEDES